MATMTALVPTRARAYCFQFIPLMGIDAADFVNDAVHTVKHRVGQVCVSMWRYDTYTVQPE